MYVVPGGNVVHRCAKFAGPVLQELRPSGGGRPGGEGQHADARRDRQLLESRRLAAVRHRAGVEPQHRRDPRIQQQRGVHNQLHHQHRYTPMQIHMHENIIKLWLVTVFLCLLL